MEETRERRNGTRMNQPQVICHCGKCNVKCNKHNKRATCADCKKVRMLVTVIEKSKMRHICDECCKAHEKRINDEQDALVWAELRKTEQTEKEMWDNPLIP